MTVLRKSGLDSKVLQGVFQMADNDLDLRLTSKEFAVAFHIVLCHRSDHTPLL